MRRSEHARHEQAAEHAARHAAPRAPHHGAVRPLASRGLPDAVPAHAREVVTSAGEPLDESTRAAFEPRFGHDFSSVRVHDDARASASAVKLNAQAYTIGNDIVLRSRSRDPELLAHELTHVVQQATGDADPGIQCRPWEPRTDFRFDRGFITSDDLLDGYVMNRLGSMSRVELRGYRNRVGDPAVIAYIDMLLMARPTERLQTDWFATDVPSLTSAGTASYWYNRTDRAYAIAPTPARMHSDPEEYDAVYAALWNVRPTGKVDGPSTELVTIPATAKRKSQLLYRFTFTPAAAAAGGKPGLSIEFVTEQKGDVVSVAAEPPKNAKVPDVTFNIDLGFDEGSDVYFKRHPEVKRQLDAWLQRASGEFDQVVVTKETPAPNAAPVERLFQISGRRKPDGQFEDLALSRLSDQKRSTATLPIDYHNRDYGDLMLEKLQTEPHPKLEDKLGYVDLANVPQDELVYVKYMIASYFGTMETRNTEVDVVVPIPKTTRQIFYTLRFRSDNEVDVERIGEKGSSDKLDPDRLDLARVRGYADHSADPAKLKAWIGKRYRGMKPTGTTVEELRASANTAMKDDAGKAPWFQQNYSMVVLDGAKTLQRLRTAHGQNAKQTPPADQKDFSEQELKVAEMSLQTLTDTIIQKLAAVRLGRKSVARDDKGAVKESIAGNAFTTGSNNTVVMYDRAFGTTLDGTYYKHADNMFRGGAEGVTHVDTADFTHEFAHILEFNRPGLKEAFLRFVKRENIAPVTGYAAQQPGKDFFTEAFSIYNTDPEWLRQNHISLYLWLDTYNRTGKIPK